jgi:hypothetical protein
MTMATSAVTSDSRSLLIELPSDRARRDGVLRHTSPAAPCLSLAQSLEYAHTRPDVSIAADRTYRYVLGSYRRQRGQTPAASTTASAHGMPDSPGTSSPDKRTTHRARLPDAALGRSFRWSFRHVLLPTTSPYHLDGVSDMTSENSTLQHGTDGRGSTSNP